MRNGGAARGKSRSGAKKTGGLEWTKRKIESRMPLRDRRNQV